MTPFTSIHMRLSSLLVDDLNRCAQEFGKSRSWAAQQWLLAARPMMMHHGHPHVAPPSYEYFRSEIRKVIGDYKPESWRWCDRELVETLQEMVKR
jgi:hypothetical protein